MHMQRARYRLIRTLAKSYMKSYEHQNQKEMMKMRKQKLEFASEYDF